MSENKTEEQLNIEDLEEENVRILTYEDDGLPDLDMEIDLSDIFDEGPESGFDDEVLKLFKHGEDDKKVSEGNVSSKTMVADRASIKETTQEVILLPQGISSSDSSWRHHSICAGTGLHDQKHRSGRERLLYR